jgi:hypothetical protein
MSTPVDGLGSWLQVTLADVIAGLDRLIGQGRRVVLGVNVERVGGATGIG